MKKIVLALIVALTGFIVMSAQPPRKGEMNPQQMVEKRVERLDKALSLTAEQKAQITKIYTAEMEAAHNEHQAKADEGQKPDRSQMQARRDATNASIEALLTPEQAAKFAQLKSRKGDRGHGKAGHKGPRRGHGKAAAGTGCGKDCSCCHQD